MEPQKNEISSAMETKQYSTSSEVFHKTPETPIAANDVQRSRATAKAAETNMSQGEISFSSYYGKQEVVDHQEAIENEIKALLELQLLDVSASIPDENLSEFQRLADIYIKQVMMGVMEYRGSEWPSKKVERYLKMNPLQDKAFLSRMLTGMYAASLHTDVPARAIDAVVAIAKLNGTDINEALTKCNVDFAKAKERLNSEGRFDTASSIDKSLREYGLNLQ